MAELNAAELSVAVRFQRPEFNIDVNFALGLDGVTGLFGPSGSGKSTLLRIIAGLETSAKGDIVFGNKVWQNDAGNVFVPPYERSIGYVFQDARLFPHLSVAGNLEFARARAVPGSRFIDYDEVLAALDLQPLLGRQVTTLSGGEQQRVAIGRALLSQPEIMLFDEPVAALDAARKHDVLRYVEHLPQRFGIPAIYVSHAANEVARLADRILILEAGRVTADGPVNAILSREDLQASALSFEAMTILDVNVVANLTDVGLARVRYADQELTAPQLPGVEPGDSARLLIRAGDVVIATSEPKDLSVRNVLTGTVTGIQDFPASAFAMVSVDIGAITLQAQLTKHAVNELELHVGSAVYALIKTASFERGD